MKLSSICTSVAAAVSLTSGALAFVPATNQHKVALSTSTTPRTTFLAGHPPHGGGDAAVTEVEAEAPVGFIDGELRGAAMRLHTRSQAPREGQAPEPSRPKKHVTTLDDYLHFLVDSQAVYQAFEDVANDLEVMGPYRNTGLERVKALDEDIAFICSEYGVARPEIGEYGNTYAKEIRKLAKDGKVPELMCHYYNHYFAHTAGGIMIGKAMAAALLDKKVLNFYKWTTPEGDVIESRKPLSLLEPVRAGIEKMAAAWSGEERKRCVDETAATFRYGGQLNSYLSGGSSPH
eukprot:CAMPEP_0181031454 /NCGR_PEP_ID=MMETSP1070-20121207/6240_1 /TAXON_ID=265543 /ORGANISM="Minutocellus polymorphus, Strain NH13" /LENGTH=289 /DNA_ID=CAMNT_0023108831 /DNA_START=50 /DNA_END=919 /DNA_ORIENTATION=+